MTDTSDQLRQQQLEQARIDLRDALDGDREAAMRLLKRVALGEFDNPYVQGYMRLAATAILHKKAETPDKKPNANMALMLDGKKSNIQRDMRITFEVMAHYQELKNLDAAILQAANDNKMKEPAVKTIYNRNKKELSAMLNATA